MKTLFFLLLFPLALLHAQIQLIKKSNDDSNTTLLVIGGIHGNEPGGYFSAAILASHYTITSKNLWIIPNLNEASIINNKRGIHGDMNRKFAHIKDTDKDKPIIEEVKKIILNKQVSLVLNLHDGHGFYRKRNQNNIYNPKAWGQTCVIDQCNLNTEQPFSCLNDIAMSVKNEVNKKLLHQDHTFNVKNTNTKLDDKAMQQSLTYFAVRHNKPAFAIETSKNLSSLSQKVFYQLLAIEEYMKIMDITFIRDFNLTEKNITKIISNYGTLAINDNIVIDLNNIKKSLSYFPIKSVNNDFKFSHPLGNVKKVKGNYQIFIGNKHITTLKPQYFKLAKNCQDKFNLLVDGKEISLPKASDFNVTADFKVIKSKKQRVNIIGYQAKGHVDESDTIIALGNLQKSYSVDRSHKTYRVEFYKKDEFCSMLMVHFK